MPPTTKPERTPEVMAQLRLEQQTNHVGLLVDWGEVDKAVKYWHAKRGDTLPYPKALQDALDARAAAAAAPEAIEVVDDPAPQGPPMSASGWPLETRGEIIRKCVNRRLVVIRIEDGRTASMWNTGIRPWKVGARVKVKLEKTEGDPIYRVC